MIRSLLRPPAPIDIHTRQRWADPEGPSFIGRQGRVLVVHDNPATLKKLETLLVATGCSVTATTSFPLAKRALRDSDIDIVVADVRLGAFNGLHLAVRTRSEYPNRAVIITNASQDVWFEHEAKSYGASFIVDPVHNSGFLETVRRALDGSMFLRSAWASISATS